ncbi:2-isopropylmalate synthase [Rhodococcus tibetensis]|uniref:2-isopropylmalate synthase n=1 Tax=Rhodococcus tibetensis TaxID=2965064 RepID=A0ABT1QMG9_9NOCA|nr:2-isopropylmalate synthase [Rhodococcus sp. FXJ9.536]MCQ4122305.1 2-isopropylmalate synthase [Rhodococcus sp. FXJ9.536]
MSTSTFFAGSCRTSTAGVDPFAARHGKPLPRDFADEAAGMSWTEFETHYGSMPGPFRLGRWSESKAAPGLWVFEATLGIGESICTMSALAPGPVSAMTAMLYGAGCSIEILAFHQHRIGHRAATFLLCEVGGVRLWTMGIGESETESALRAMISGANRVQSV